MLRVPQHERKKINDINSFPFVTSINSVQALSAVEGLLRVFQQPARLNRFREAAGRLARDGASYARSDLGEGGAMIITSS